MMNIKGHNGEVFLRVLIAGATLLLIAATIIVVLSNYRNREETNLRKAIAISEFGLLEAMQKLGEQPSWRAGFKRTEYEQGWYSVVLVPESSTSSDTLYLSVTSRGESGSVADEKIVHLKAAVANGDTLWSRREN